MTIGKINRLISNCNFERLGKLIKNHKSNQSQWKRLNPFQYSGAFPLCSQINFIKPSEGPSEPLGPK